MMSDEHNTGPNPRHLRQKYGVENGSIKVN